MKSNKGFTLIELLAIIVILAIIAFITVPKVTGYVASARKGAAKTGAMEYVEAFEKTAVADFTESGYFSSPSIRGLPVTPDGLQKEIEMRNVIRAGAEIYKRYIQQ